MLTDGGTFWEKKKKNPVNNDNLKKKKSFQIQRQS